jgi:hypothetical protein
MTPKVSIRRALSDPALLGSVLAGDSWKTWRVLLIAAMGEKLEQDELPIFNAITGGRTAPPPQRVEEFVGIIGRRGGKSRAMSALAVYIAALCDHRDRLVRGERGVCVLIAPDQRQAKIDLEYIAGTLEGTPVLKKLIANRTADSIELSNKITIEVRAASFRRLRGVTAVAVLADESCFFYADDGGSHGSQNADSEILNAVRPSLATTAGLLAIISSPHARRGETWELFRKHYGPDGDPLVLVAQGSSRDFNPSLPQSVVDRALERDPAAASAEFLAQWRTDLQQFVPLEIVEACVEPGCRERAPLPRHHYTAFCDPSGGSSDSMTMAIGHVEGDSAVLDLAREVRAPFSPESVVEEFSTTLKSYGCTRVRGDKYAGMWPTEQFAKRGVTYEPAEKNKSEIYLNFLPQLNARRARLLDNPRLISQLCGLERRTARGGRDSIDHSPGAKDDVANAVAGVLVELVGDPHAAYTYGILNNISVPEDTAGHSMRRLLMSGLIR